MCSSRSGFFLFFLKKCTSLSGAGWHFSWTQVPCSLVLFSLRSFLFTCFRKRSGLLECLICSVHTFSWQESCQQLVYNNANCMPGNIVNSSSCARVTLVEHFFSNTAHSLEIYNTTFLVDSCVCGQRNNFMFSKRPREHIAGPFSTSPASLNLLFLLLFMTENFKALS